MKHLAENDQMLDDLEGEETGLKAKLEALTRRLAAVRNQLTGISTLANQKEAELDGKMIRPGLTGTAENNYGGKRAAKLYDRARQGTSDTGRRAAAIARRKENMSNGGPASEKNMAFVEMMSDTPQAEVPVEAKQEEWEKEYEEFVNSQL